MTDKSNLSGREKEILGLVAEGLTNREIAQRLSISHNTVKVHLSNIFEKIDVSSRTEATVFAIEHRIVDVPGGETPAAPEDDGVHRLTLQSIWVLGSALFLIAILGIVIGGRLFYQSPSPGTVSSIEQSERWQELAPLPEPRINMAAVAYSGEIYVIGGEGPEGVSGKGFRYLPDLDEWLPIADKPTPVSGVGAVVIGEKIFVPGGEGADGQPTDILEIYNPRQDTWEEGTRLPEALSAYALADFEGKMYLFGGWDGERARDSVWVYEPAEDGWRAGTQMDAPIYDSAAVALTDRIVVLGGRNETVLLASAQSYTPSRDASDENPWMDFIAMPQGRADFGAASIYDLVYLLGGELDGEGEAGLILTEDKWVPLPVEHDYTDSPTRLLSIGQLLYSLASTPEKAETEFLAYQAFYYSIYIPIVP